MPFCILWDHKMYFILFQRSLSSVLLGLLLLYEPASRVLIIGPFQNDKVTLFSFPISCC